MFDLSKLVVLHLYNYSKPAGQTDFLKRFLNQCQAVPVSTCMRHIYILDKECLTSSSQKEAYDALMQSFKNDIPHAAQIKIEIYYKEEAYSFLLYWMCAGINPNKLFQDCRVLGSVREAWDKINKSGSEHFKQIAKNFQIFFNELFVDAKKLRGLVNGLLNDTDLSVKLKKACFNCALTRLEGYFSGLQHFNYSYFCEDNYREQIGVNLKESREKLIFQLEKTQNSLFQSSLIELQKNGITRSIEVIENLLDKLKEQANRENLNPKNL